MIYKLSNTASDTTLKTTFNIPLKYPYFYRKQILMNGLEEVTIPIITMEESKVMVPAIWGILPENYKDDWETFQEVFNSLNISIQSLGQLSWCNTALMERRCFIPITGYFTSYLINGELYPYYFHQESGGPFFLAGIYNKTQDGFLTAAILTTSTNQELKSLCNINKAIPIMLPNTVYDEWLNGDLADFEIHQLVKSTPDIKLTGHPISKEFFKNNISYTTMLSPVNYNDAPRKIILSGSTERIVP
ncbi:SOS response-associated peptidase family protein [Arenibacter certesii]|uniref:Abasic site processing protein n=1 Tax=Arenibacter certesii TaxID=228955 RepID=A0A918MLX1_9FLAO|nr:SOS response-associated peptidase family protein [Arenibacter certesii]GGW34635.1 hypothetical protein GCM10007383_19590 [Arenibacter certesii]